MWMVGGVGSLRTWKHFAPYVGVNTGLVYCINIKLLMPKGRHKGKRPSQIQELIGKMSPMTLNINNLLQY